MGSAGAGSSSQAVLCVPPPKDWPRACSSSPAVLFLLSHVFPLVSVSAGLTLTSFKLMLDRKKERKRRQAPGSTCIVLSRQHL